ncbi:MAG: hypothetical protein JRE21_08230 [Deltaproteobacteria bacterium]|jgi:hypothetical protein|nr:hypothetical protein [Deltaproteobacteria bacterium]
MIAKQIATMSQHIVDALESRGWAPQLIILLIFSFGVFRNIHLPGLYWDAVNPDYLAAKILAENDYTSHFMPWGSFPFLGNYYHGAMHTYFGLVFFNIFGFSVFSLRIAHAIFGLGILLVSNQLISKATGSKVFALLVCSLLALDPAFIFSFRTQAYITLSPVFFLLISLNLLVSLRPRNGNSGGEISGISLIALSGFLSGWAFYGYFIYLFFLPAFIGIVAHRSYKLGYPPLKMTLLWLTGFGLGTVLYFAGYVKQWLVLGSVSEIFKNLSGLGIAGNPIEILNRPYLVYQNLVTSLAGLYQYTVIFSEELLIRQGLIKLEVMAFSMLIAISVAAVRKRISTPLAYSLLLVASFLVVALFFAARIAPHHTILMLPFLYIVSGIALHHAGGGLIGSFRTLSGKLVSAALVSVLIFLVVLNLQHQNIFQKRLLETGGVNLYSDSLTLLAEEARHNPSPPYYVFGEWGFTGAFAFLTEGKVPYNSSMDEWAIGLVPCSQPLEILFWGASNPTVESFAGTQGRVSNRKVYYHRDGAVSFTALMVTDRTNCSLTDTYPSF